MGEDIKMLSIATPPNQNAFKIMLVFLVPPWAVYLDTGLSRTFWLNVFLTLAGIYPGVLHGVFVVIKHLR